MVPMYRIRRTHLEFWQIKKCGKPKYSVMICLTYIERIKVQNHAGTEKLCIIGLPNG